MKILYGVQATGNGHISRSREVIKNLRDEGHKVSVIFSGRKEADLWGVEDFKPYKVVKGFTFVTNRGKIHNFKTAMQLDFIRFINDIRSINYKNFDLIISDFEPVTAWMAKIRKLPSIGIGHQYAFNYNIPVSGFNPMAKLILKTFAPCKYNLGLHWHHFNESILPPIIPELKLNGVIKNKILIYLGFEEIEDVVKMVSPINNADFYIYAAVNNPSDKDNIHLRPFSRENFLNDLESCEGVISNAGFELPSEAIQLRKKILLKPIKGQYEQEANAKAIVDLKAGHVIKDMNTETVRQWIETPIGNYFSYPDVAKEIACWITNGELTNIKDLSEKCWKETLAS